MPESSVPTAAAVPTLDTVLFRALSAGLHIDFRRANARSQIAALRAAVPGSPVRIIIDFSVNPEGELSAAPTYEAVECDCCGGKGEHVEREWKAPQPGARSRWVTIRSRPCARCGGSGSLYRRLEGGTT